MSTETWPAGRDWLPKSFGMQVMANERPFVGYYSGQAQILDLLGEYWMCSIVLPSRKSKVIGAQREALLSRLRRSNTVSIWHMERPAPRGTQRGAPTLSSSVAQLASTIAIQGTASATLLEGDLIGFGGQVSMVTANVTANGSGVFSSVPIWPRARAAVSGGSAVTWDKPTVLFRLAEMPAAVNWVPGHVSDELTLNFTEA